MDAGFEHTMLGVCGPGKFVVVVGDRCTCDFAWRDAAVAAACSRSAGQPGIPQLWDLRVTQKYYEPVRDYFETIASKSKTTEERVIADHNLSANELRRRS